MVHFSLKYLWAKKNPNVRSVWVSKSRSAGDFPNKPPLIQGKEATSVTKCWCWAGTAMWSYLWNISLILHDDSRVSRRKKTKAATTRDEAFTQTEQPVSWTLLMLLCCECDSRAWEMKIYRATKTELLWL